MPRAIRKWATVSCMSSNVIYGVVLACSQQRLLKVTWLSLTFYFQSYTCTAADLPAVGLLLEQKQDMITNITKLTHPCPLPPPCLLFKPFLTTPTSLSLLRPKQELDPSHGNRPKQHCCCARWYRYASAQTRDICVYARMCVCVCGRQCRAVCVFTSAACAPLWCPESVKLSPQAHFWPTSVTQSKPRSGYANTQTHTLLNDWEQQISGLWVELVKI